MTPRQLALLNSLTIVVACGFFVSAVAGVRGHIEAQALDERLRARAAAVGTIVPVASSATLDVDTFGMPPVYIQVATAEGVVLARSTNLGDHQLPVDPVQQGLALHGEASFATLTVEGQSLRSYMAPLVPAATTAPQPSTAALVQLAAPLDDDLRADLPALIVGGLSGVPLALLFSWLLARWALGPIETLAVTVRAINSTEDLGRRVPVELAARRDAVGRLARDVNAMFARLQSATEQLHTMLDAQRRFVADASHELRTPLTSIRGNMQLLMLWFAEQAMLPSDRRVEEVLSDVSLETERMSRLVDGLLVLAHADAEVHLPLGPTQLTPVLQAAFKAGRLLAEDVDLAMASLAPDVWVQADADRLEQLVLILLDNGVRYTPGGGRVTLSATPVGRDDRPGVMIEVTDSGPGVPLGERSRIFERFYRTEAAREDPRGNGLGLAVARWIVREHHGTIEVRDAEPHGSTFSVWLPTVPAPE